LIAPTSVPNVQKISSLKLLLVKGSGLNIGFNDFSNFLIFDLTIWHICQMNTGKYVFSQATDFLSFDDFNKFLKKYKGNYKIKPFSCWNQLLCMLFGQLAKRESLSDLVTCLQTQQTKWYHLGLGTTITKSNLAYANENRDWRMYADFAYTLIAKARKICTASSDFELKIDGNVYAVDSTTIDLCLSVFWWAKFRKHRTPYLIDEIKRLFAN